MENENYKRENRQGNYSKDNEQPARTYNRDNEQLVRLYNKDSDPMGRSYSREYNREYSREYNRENEELIRARKQDNRKKEKDYLTQTIMVQSIVCVLLFLLLFVLSKISPNSYDILKNKMDGIMSNDMSVSEVVDAFKNVAGYLIEPASQWQSDEESVNATTKQNREETTKASEAATQAGVGGADITTADQTLPSNVSYSPYVTTAKITLPVKGGKISSYFGFRDNPITGKYSFHTGLDIAVDSGTKIATAYGGTVKESGQNKSAGKYILLQHANGLETFYCHCSEIIAQTGAVVNAGETIALVGSTGDSTGPHLHFEIRINGVKYNPLWVLKGMIDEV